MLSSICSWTFASFCSIRIREDFHHAADHRRQVKPLHYHLIRSKFQLIQRQKLLYQPVHLICLIHNHIAVKLTALGIFRDIVLKPFRISLDQRNGVFNS